VEVRSNKFRGKNLSVTKNSCDHTIPPDYTNGLAYNLSHAYPEPSLL